MTTDIGTLIDSQTAAETDRVAGGVQVSVSRGDLQLSSAVEYRKDVSEQPDLGENERKTWLFRNNVKYQINDSGRVLGKLNHSTSESSLGAFYDGGFTEAVLGYAYRPRPAEHAGEVHVLLQRADDGPAHAKQPGRGIRAEVAHRID